MMANIVVFIIVILGCFNVVVCCVLVNCCLLLVGVQVMELVQPIIVVVDDLESSSTNGMFSVSIFIATVRVQVKMTKNDEVVYLQVLKVYTTCTCSLVLCYRF
jgi:hypothetical protein